jgi:hypothetical protein
MEHGSDALVEKGKILGGADAMHGKINDEGIANCCTAYSCSQTLLHSGADGGQYGEDCVIEQDGHCPAGRFHVRYGGNRIDCAALSWQLRGVEGVQAGGYRALPVRIPTENCHLPLQASRKAFEQTMHAKAYYGFIGMADGR